MILYEGNKWSGTVCKVLGPERWHLLTHSGSSVPVLSTLPKEEQTVRILFDIPVVIWPQGNLPSLLWDWTLLIKLTKKIRETLSNKPFNKIWKDFFLSSSIVKFPTTQQHLFSKVRFYFLLHKQLPLYYFSTLFTKEKREKYTQERKQVSKSLSHSNAIWQKLNAIQDSEEARPLLLNQGE